MMILRLFLKILVAPILLAVQLMIVLCTFLTAISAGLLGLLSFGAAGMAVLVIVSGMTNSGIALLVIAWLISPVGLPLLAEKLLFLLYDLCDNFKSILCG